MSQELQVFTSIEGFEAAQRMAKALAASPLVPQTFKDVGSALIAVELSQRMDMPLLAVMQNMYIVHGKPAWSSSYLIASFNATGKFAPITYDMGVDGEAIFNNKKIPNATCRAISKCLATGKEIKGAKISLEMAIKEGWYGKTGSKWLTMPEQMLQYRAAAFMIRATAPEVAFGMQTREEAIDIEEKIINVTPAPESTIPVAIPVKKAPIKQAEAAPVESTPDSDIDALREALKSVQSIAELDDILTKNKLQFLELHKNDPEIFMELSDLAEDKRREFEQK